MDSNIVRAVTALLAALVTALSPAHADSERTPFETPLERAGFELIKSQRGVRVFKHRDADDIRIAAEGELPAPPERVLAVLLDYAQHAGRVPRLAESRVLSQGQASMLVYQRLSLPVISDRDFTLRVRWGEAGGERWIAYDGANGDGPPPRDGIVRITKHSGSWQLRPLRGGTATYARYQARLDLAGWMPRWLARSRAGNDIPGLFTAICRMLGGGRCP